MAAPFGVLELTWSRRATGTDQAAATLLTPDPGGAYYSVWTGPLPDLVLQPKSQVTLQQSRASGSGLHGWPQVTELTITVTRNPNTPQAQTVQVPVTPTWIPVAIGDEGSE